MGSAAARLFPDGERGIGCASVLASNKEESLSVVKIIEIVGNSTKSSDDAVQQGLAEARKTLRNIKAVDVVSVGLRGDDLEEWRAHLRIGILVEGVD